MTKRTGRPKRRESDNIKALERLIKKYFERCDNHLEVKKNLLYDEQYDKYQERLEEREALRLTNPKQTKKMGKPSEPKKEWKKQVSCPYTVTGLANYLGCTRETLAQYEKDEEFSDTIKRAKSRVEEFNETRLHTASSATGPIFALKNFGWKDKYEVDQTNTNTELPINDKQKKAIKSILAHAQ